MLQIAGEALNKVIMHTMDLIKIENEKKNFYHAGLSSSHTTECDYKIHENTVTARKNSSFGREIFMFYPNQFVSNSNTLSN